MKVKKFNTGYYDAESYLINDKILIDTGINSQNLIEAIEKVINIEELKLIILTHCHFDHSYAAKKIAEKSGAKIAIHTDDADSLYDKKLSASSAFNQDAPAFKPDILLNDKEKIEIGNNEYLEVIHTPGHTPGCICLYEPKSKSLFSGDTVFPNGSIGRSDLPGGDSSTLIKSIEKLTELDVEIMYPGHGETTSHDVKKQIHASYQMSKGIFRF